MHGLGPGVDLHTACGLDLYPLYTEMIDSLIVTSCRRRYPVITIRTAKITSLSGIPVKSNVRLACL